MDYFSLYSSYHFDELLSLMFTVFGVTILVLLIAYNIDDAVKASRKGSEFTLLSYGNVGVLVVALSFMAFGYGIKLSQNGSINELNNTTASVCGDSIDNVVYNVEYLSDKYNERLDYFKFVYGDDAPSRKEYINNILNEFYGQTVSSGRVNYSDEIKEVEQSLRKGVQ